MSMDEIKKQKNTSSLVTRIKNDQRDNVPNHDLINQIVDGDSFIDIINELFLAGRDVSKLLAVSARCREAMLKSAETVIKSNSQKTKNGNRR